MLRNITLATIAALLLVMLVPHANATPTSSPDVKLSFHILKKGQDGWNYQSPSIGFQAPCVVNNTTGICNRLAINGTDLTDIKNDSIIIPQIINASVPTYYSYSVGCFAYDPVSNSTFHGFGLFCSQNGWATPGTWKGEPELEFSVLNP